MNMLGTCNRTTEIVPFLRKTCSLGRVLPGALKRPDRFLVKMAIGLVPLVALVGCGGEPSQDGPAGTPAGPTRDATEPQGPIDGAAAAAGPDARGSVTDLAAADAIGDRQSAVGSEASTPVADEPASVPAAGPAVPQVETASVHDRPSAGGGVLLATGSSSSPAAKGGLDVHGSSSSAAGRHHTLRKEPVDPIEANGPIFEGWPRPDLAICISGELIGYLEPCGCAGLENQKGGMKRRHTLFKQLAAKGWPLLEVDLGGQVKRFGPQAEIKYRRAIEAFVQMGYRAIGFGPEELRLPVDQLVYVLSNLPEGQNPLVSANVGLLGMPSPFSKRLLVVEVGGLRVGITSILGASYQRQLANNSDIELLTPDKALAEVVPQLREQADYLILLSHASVKESTELAEQFPDFDIVVTAGGADEPPNHMAPIGETKSRLVEVGHKGMYVAVVGLYNDPQQPAVRYQRVPLDARFPDSPEMQAMMVDYQKELATLGFDGLALKPAAHPSGRKFVGSKQCAECHTEATAVWESTPHAHAMETLVKLTPPRHHDPECICCHVVGWEPQKYFPFVSGYLDRQKTGHVENVGCENCHGPGSDHVAAEEAEGDVDQARLDRHREEMRVELLEGEAEGASVDGRVVQGPVTRGCYECHDLDNSPDFDFVKYWPTVEHYGTD
jgi:hypothetical protein